MRDDPFAMARLVFEALQQLGSTADAPAIVDRVRRLEVGLPAEDELSSVLSWLGRCHLVHKLDQLQTPPASKETWQVPDLLAVFKYAGRSIPVLIEVKTSLQRRLSWQPGYRDALQRYAELLNLPLLIAWRYRTFWTLFEARHLQKAVTNYNISFKQAMQQSLMSELAGDFSYSLRPGCGLHLQIRKLSEEKDGKLDGVIERVYWTNGDGVEVTEAPGMTPLMLCIDQDSVLEDRGEVVVQSYLIPDDSTAQFAHRALAILAGITSRGDEVHWRRMLEEGTVPPMAQVNLRDAAQQALEAGFLQYGFLTVPHSMPAFMTDDREEPT